MTKDVLISITVGTKNGKTKQESYNINSDEYENDLLRVEKKIMKMVGAAVFTSYEDSLRKEEFRNSKILRTEKRRYEFQTFEQTFYRREYRDEKGKKRIPLDELLHFERYQRRSRRATEQICAEACMTTYRNVAEIESLHKEKPISASTISREVKRLGQKIDAQDRQYEAEDPGKTECPVLRGETDGVWISLQREQEKKTEIRTAVVYSGKKTITKGRKRLVNKMTLTALGVTTEEWQKMLRERMYTTYDLSATKLLLVGGDGGNWVGSSFDLVGIKAMERVLDPFHVKRNIKRAFGKDADTDALIQRLYQNGFDSIKEDLQASITKDKTNRQKTKKNCFDYLQKHADEIIPLEKRGLPFANLGSLGVMESNVDKLVAHRMKNRGTSWTKRGAASMLALLRHKNELKNHAFQYSELQKMAAKERNYKRVKTMKNTNCVHKASFPILNAGKMSTPMAETFKRMIDN